MRKLLTSLCIATLAAGSIGCAFTDYGQTPDWSTDDGDASRVDIKKTHGIADLDQNRINRNTQQTIENAVQTHLMLHPVLAAANFECNTTGATMSAGDAKDWYRFNGPHIFAVEAAVLYPGQPRYDGIWSMGAGKDVADGTNALGLIDGREDARVATWYGSNPSPVTFANFTAGVVQFRGQYGQIENDLLGQAMVGYMPANFMVESTAIDGSPGINFGTNVVACSPFRAGAFIGDADYSTFLAALARFGEGRVQGLPTPVRAAGLAEFLSGQPMTVSFEGVEITASANLLADGRWDIAIQGLASNGVASYVAENPVHVTTQPGFKTFQVNVPGNGELANMARFAIDAGLTDRQLTLGGKTIPELGIALPPIALELSGENFQKFIDGQTGGTDR